MRPGIMAAGFACLALSAGAGAALPVERCMNLSNFLEVPKGKTWAYPHKPAHIDAIAAAGFDTLRLPINAGTHWNGTALDQGFADQVQATVKRARAAGLFVIVDLHHYDAFIDDPIGKGDEFLAIWTALAAMFAGQDGLAFELLNEPTGDTRTEDFLPFYDKALAIIRETHPDAWVIFGGAHWNNLKQMQALPRPTDPRVAHTFHFYQPYKFTHQQAPWHDDPLPVRPWGTREERERVATVMTRAASHHTPVFLGEFGAINTAPTKDRLAWLTAVRTEAERAGLPWCHWGFGARFGAFDPVADTWKTDVLDTLMQ